MPYFVYKVNRNGRVLIGEYLYLEEAQRRAQRMRGAVVTDELGKAVKE